MAATERIPTRMIGSRGQDLDSIRALGPQGPEVSILPSTVDEALIRKEIAVAPTQGFEYMAALSRNRFAAQKAEMQTQEPDTDYALITSDTGLLVEKNGKFAAVTEVAPPEQARAYLEEMNKKGKATLIGAITFGRKQGESMMTVLTFYDVPLSQPLTSLPENPQDLLALKDPNADAEVGYIEPKAGEKGQVRFIKKSIPVYPLKKGESAISDRRFMTGLTEAVVNLAEKAAVFDREVAPVMEQEVADHPFNTMAFYSAFKQSGEKDLLTFYTKLLAHPEDHFAQYGGNCTLFVMDMEKKLKEMGHESQVAVFTSDTPSHPQGHGALFTEEDGIAYFIDPGLTFTYPIPISRDVPLFPSVFLGNKVVLLDIADVNEDGLPDLVILKGGKKIVLPGKQVVGVEQFRELMPQVLVDLHGIRSKAKIDYHDRHGEKKGSVSIDRKTNEVGIAVNGGTVSIPLQEIVTRPSMQAGLTSAYAEYGIDFMDALAQLQTFAN